MEEQSICSARASVMIYDDISKKWLPGGTSSGVSRVHIYQNLGQNTFRVVGRKIQDHEVVINCAILKGLKYFQATATFHQWRDNKQVYGLNFSMKEEAENFAESMLNVLDLLNTGNNIKQIPVNNCQPVYGHIGVQPEYTEVRNVNINSSVQQQQPQQPRQEQQQLISQQQQQQQQQQLQMQHQQWSNNSNDTTYWKSHQIQEMNNLNQASQNMAAHQQQPQYGHHRTPSAPNTPDILSLMQQQQQQQQQQNQQQMHIQSQQQMSVPSSQMQQQPPQAPPQPMVTTVSAPPPPPPMPTNGAPPPPPLPAPGTLNRQSSNNTQAVNPNPISNLAAALANAKLKKTPGKDITKENDATANKSGGGSATPASGMASMMDEMAKTLARRRAQTEGQINNSSGDNNSSQSAGKGGAVSNAKANNSSSPSKDNVDAGSVQRMQRTGSLDSGQLNGFEHIDIDRFKQEMMNEIRKEINKMKMEIIDAIRMELTRR